MRALDDTEQGERREPPARGQQLRSPDDDRTEREHERRERKPPEHERLGAEVDGGDEHGDEAPRGGERPEGELPAHRAIMERAGVSARR